MDGSQSLRKSGQFSFRAHQKELLELYPGRNPFVSQVSSHFKQSLTNKYGKDIIVAIPS